MRSQQQHVFEYLIFIYSVLLMRQMYIWHIDVFQLVIKVVKLRMKLMIEFRYNSSIENQNNLFHFKCKYSNVKFEMFIRTCESCLNVISPLRQQEGEENEVMFSMLFSWVTTGIDSYCMVHNIEHSLIPILSWLGKHQIFVFFPNHEWINNNVLFCKSAVFID